MEQAIPAPAKRSTVEEYLRMEEASKTRHEFRNGQVVDLAGGTSNHSAIAVNLVARLLIGLQGRPCRPYGSDLRLKIQGTPNYCYPDVSIICGPLIYDPPDRMITVTNPQVVIEVTSPYTEKDDRRDKFYDYMRIESLREYILVAQDRMRVDTFYRQFDGIWAIAPSFEKSEDRVLFRSLDVSIPLTEIYAGTVLPEPEV